MSLIPTTQVNVSPDDYRRKAAYALMQQGMDGAPVQAWSQGLSRVANALVGSLEMNRLDDRQKQEESDATKAYLNYLTPSPASPPSATPAAPAPMPSQPSPVASALAKPVVMASNDPTAVSGPRPGGPVMPTGKVWGDQEAEAAGIYEKPKVAMALANPNAPMQPTPVQSVPVGPPPASPVTEALAPKTEMAQAEPDVTTKIRALLQSPNKAERALGKSLAENAITQSIKPETTDEIKEYNLAVKQAKVAGEKPPSFIEFKTNLKKAGKPETTVNVGGGSDKQIFDAMDESAKAARQTAAGLTGLREARNAIQGGAITGTGANQILALQKAASALGLANSDKIVNTETFRSAIAPQVAAVLKSTVGTTNISNTDREFAEKAAGGNITLDEKSITRLMDIMERAGTSQLEAHQKKVDKIYADPEKHGRERALFGVDMPAAPIAAPAKPDVNALKKKYGLQ